MIAKQQKQLRRVRNSESHPFHQASNGRNLAHDHALDLALDLVLDLPKDDQNHHTLHVADQRHVLLSDILDHLGDVLDHLGDVLDLPDDILDHLGDILDLPDDVHVVRDVIRVLLSEEIVEIEEEGAVHIQDRRQDIQDVDDRIPDPSRGRQ